MKECRDKNIPEHLWQNDRENIVDFEQDEQLYRRFQSSLPRSLNSEDDDFKKFTGEVFQIKNDSYNRSSFCDSHLDVLYNEDGEYKEHYGVLAIDSNKAFFEFEIKVNNDLQKVVVYPKHDCLKCNYPHSILQYTVNGEIPENPRPGRQIKDAVRKRLFTHVTILKKSS